MSMTKQQMIGAACGGVFVLCAGALGWFLYDAISVRSEAEERLDSEREAFRQFNQASVFPSKKSIDSVKSNETSYTEWHASALELAARGDSAPSAAEEPSVFKQRLQAEVRRLSELPGGVDGRLCASGFLFGFEQYLGENGTLPQESDVPRLAVQLDTISHVVDLFGAAGIYEVTSLQRLSQKSEEEEDSSKAKNKKGAKKAADEDAPQMTCLEYAFEFTARPAAFVKVFNALTADPRFIVVKKLSFRQSSDTIVDRLAAVESAAAQAASAQAGASSSSSRRRRRRAEAEEEQAQAPAAEKTVDRLVSDPETDAPVRVSFVLAVYDFGRGAKAVADKGDTEKKEDK